MYLTARDLTPELVVSIRCVANHGTAAHYPSVIGHIKWPRSMHDTAVIPDHDVIRLSVVTIDTRRIDNLPIDTIDQVATGKVVHTNDGLCMIAKV